MGENRGGNHAMVSPFGTRRDGKNVRRDGAGLLITLDSRDLAGNLDVASRSGRGSAWLERLHGVFSTVFATHCCFGSYKSWVTIR